MKRVEVEYCQKVGEVVARVQGRDEQMKVIRREDMPKELRRIGDVITLRSYLKDAYIRTSELSNGDVRLDVLRRLKGGMLGKGEDTVPLSIAAMFAQRTAELVQASLGQIDALDRQAVIILGPTGVGKSTLINILAGVRLVSVRDESTGVMRIEARDPLPDFRIGHDVASETTVPHKWKSPDGVVYWDCPGFIDNRGAEQEIANASFIQRLFSASHEVKIVIMLKDSDLIDTRSTHILSLTNHLANLFGDDVVKVLSSISLVISHASPSREVTHVRALIERVIAESPILQERQRTLLKALKDNVIGIFKTPVSEGELNASMRDVILCDAGTYAHGICINITLSARTHTTVYENYQELINVLQSNIAEFSSAFKEHIELISSTQGKATLQGVYSTLSSLKFDIPMDEMMAKCKTIDPSFESAFSLTHIDPRLTKGIEIDIKFLKQFLDIREHSVYDAWIAFQAVVAESKSCLSASVRAFEIREAEARAKEEARQKAIADEKIRQTEIARRKAEAEAAATLERIRAIEKQRVEAEQMIKMNEDLLWLRAVSSGSKSSHYVGSSGVAYRGYASASGYFQSQYPDVKLEFYMSIGDVQIGWGVGYEREISRRLGMASSIVTNSIAFDLAEFGIGSGTAVCSFK